MFEEFQASELTSFPDIGFCRSSELQLQIQSGLGPGPRRSLSPKPCKAEATHRKQRQSASAEPRGARYDEGLGFWSFPARRLLETIPCFSALLPCEIYPEIVFFVLEGELKVA